MTAGELTSRMLELAGEDSASPVYYTEDTAKAALNEAQRLFALLTLCYEVTVQLPLAKESPWTSVRTAYPNIMVPLWVGIGGRKLRPRSLRELDALDEDWQSTTGTAEAYCFLGATEILSVYKQPVDDSTLTIVGASVPPQLIADSDEPVVPVEYHNALVDYGVVRLRAMEGGNELLSEAWRLDRFLDAVAAQGNYTRGRSRSKRYDVRPFEMERFDRAAFLGGIVAAAKQGRV